MMVIGWGSHAVNLHTWSDSLGHCRVGVAYWQIASYMDKNHPCKMEQICLTCVLEAIALSDNNSSSNSKNFAGLVKIPELRTDRGLGEQWLAVKTVTWTHRLHHVLVDSVSVLCSQKYQRELQGIHCTFVGSTFSRTLFLGLHGLTWRVIISPVYLCATENGRNTAADTRHG